jgi:predicted metal-dependent RNase
LRVALVNKIKKRVELRAETQLLLDKEQTEKEIRKIIPEEAEITQILFTLSLKNGIQLLMV